MYGYIVHSAYYRIYSQIFMFQTRDVEGQDGPGDGSEGTREKKWKLWDQYRS